MVGLNKQHDGNSDLIRLWTIQPESVLERLRLEKSLFVDPALCECLADWPVPYEWMRTQMSTRLPQYEGHYPWWAWYCPKPDLRKFRWSHPPGQKLVRIEMQMPGEDVLLSVFSAWEMVLGKGYVAFQNNDMEIWEATLCSMNIPQWPQWQLPEPLHSDLQASWNRIFDLKGLEAGGIWSTDWIQATFEQLKWEQITGVTSFSTT